MIRTAPENVPVLMGLITQLMKAHNLSTEHIAEILSLGR
jgi:hypothetical protein